MRVATWNIWAKGSARQPRHWLAIADELLDWNLDVIGLQEVDHFWGERTDRRDVAHEIAARMRYRHLYAPAIDEQARQYGVAILLRPGITVIEWGARNLSPRVNWNRADHQTEPRVAAWAVLADSDGRLQLFVTTHLAATPHVRSTPVTREQTASLLCLVEDLRRIYPQVPVTIGGDFNLTPQEPEISLIAASCPLRSTVTEPTWPVHDYAYGDWHEPAPATLCIDYLFSDLPLATVVADTDLSDHRPVIGSC